MRTVPRLRQWVLVAAREHWLSLLLLAVPIHIVVWRSETLTLLFAMIVPITAFIVGATLQPRHIWPVWLGSVVIQWVAMGIFSKYSDPGDETVVSLLIEAFAWMALGVLVPCWLGRLAGGELGNSRDHDKTSGRMLS